MSVISQEAPSKRWTVAELVGGGPSTNFLDGKDTDLMKEKEPKGELLEMGDNLERPCDRKTDCGGQNKVLKVLWPQCVWLWDDAASKSSEVHITLIILDIGHCNTIGDQERYTKQVRVSHDTLECAGLSARVPSNAL